MDISCFDLTVAFSTRIISVIIKSWRNLGFLVPKIFENVCVMIQIIRIFKHNYEIPWQKFCVTYLNI